MVFGHTSAITRWKRGILTKPCRELIKTHINEISENLSSIFDESIGNEHKKIFINIVKKEAKEKKLTVEDDITLREAFKLLLNGVLQETVPLLNIPKSNIDINDLIQMIRDSDELSEENFLAISNALIEKLQWNGCKQEIFKTLANDFISNEKDNNIYVDNYNRMDILDIDDENNTVELTRNWTSYIINKSNKPFSETIFRRFSYHGDVTDLTDINTPGNKRRMDIFKECVMSVEISIGNKVYSHEECFEFFEVLTPHNKFIPCKSNNMEIQFNLKPALFENCGERIRLHCELTTKNALTIGSTTLLFRFKWPYKSYLLTVKLSPRTAAKGNREIYIAPFERYYDTKMNKDRSDKTVKPDTKDDSMKQYSFNDLWALPGTGIYYHAKPKDFLDIK